MNDRYLFKAIDINSVWRTGLLIALKGNRCAIEESDGSKWACDAKTLCQCTGLKDKNGNLIWENDICDRKEQYPEIVKYCNGDWTLDYSYAIHKESGGCYCNLGFYVEERKCVEAIGNIFDNKELLESEKK
jgi:uncharacterized phage protein (TIGR01671 family)